MVIYYEYVSLNILYSFSFSFSVTYWDEFISEIFWKPLKLDKWNYMLHKSVSGLLLYISVLLIKNIIFKVLWRIYVRTIRGWSLLGKEGLGEIAKIRKELWDIFTVAVSLKFATSCRFFVAIFSLFKTWKF